MSISRLRCWKASGCAFHRSALFLQRFANALRDHCRIVVESKHHRPLESLRAGDQDPEATPEGIGGDPRFVRATRMPTPATTAASKRSRRLPGTPLMSKTVIGIRHIVASLVLAFCFSTINGTSWAGFSEGTMEYMPEKSIPTNEPRWPAVLALLSIGGLYYALPSELTVGPDWLALALVAALAIPATISHHRGNWRLSHFLGYAATVVVTLSVGISLALLISRLPAHKDPPGQLLLSAGALWICNLLVFACWYWRLDAGGPHQRALRRSHTDGAFLFPQMVLDADLRREMGEDQWRPGFVDYLFLAFNTSTAFSPTDVPVLSRWAKVLMMVQASISLATIAILAARAVNIL